MNVLDDFNSECLVSVPDFSLSGLRVIRELQAIIAIRGNPATNGPAGNRVLGLWPIC